MITQVLALCVAVQADVLKDVFWDVRKVHCSSSA